MEAFLCFAAFLTSTLTAIVGVGGGLILIAIMPGFVPAAALIPVHGLVQLASNASRAAFGWSDIRWQYLPTFALGSILGGVLGWQFIRLINLDYITLLIAAFILVNVWFPAWLERLPIHRNEMFTLGLLQTGVNTVGGLTGPLSTASLQRRGEARDQIVCTTAAQMCVTHFIKVVAFVALGVQIFIWWKLVLGMSFAVVLGSWVGTRTRAKLDPQLFTKVLNALLTVLALRMIYITLV